MVSPCASRKRPASASASMPAFLRESARGVERDELAVTIDADAAFAHERPAVEREMADRPVELEACGRCVDEGLGDAERVESQRVESRERRTGELPPRQARELRRVGREDPRYVDDAQ